MTIHPLVSVYMPVYNAASYLREAVGSILDQTFRDLELIMVDDGSSDSSLEIMTEYEDRDSRVRVFRQDHAGRVEAANLGIRKAGGKYVVRMDADDVSRRDRIEKQVEFMEAHEDIGVCGTWLRCFGERSNYMISPTDPEIIRCTLLFESSVWNGTSMVKHELLGDHGFLYRNLTEHGMAEDYDLWARIAFRTQMANIPEVLLYYRAYSGQSAGTYIDDKYVSVRKIRLEMLDRLGIHPSDEEFEAHQSVAYMNVPTERKSISRAETWLRTLRAQNERNGICDRWALSQVLYERWLRICLGASQLGMWTWRTHTGSPLVKGVNRNPLTEVRLLAKCILSRSWRGKSCA